MMKEGKLKKATNNKIKSHCRRYHNLQSLSRIIPIILLFILATLQSSPAFSQTSSKGGTFLPMGWGARGASLADAGTIIIRDDRSVYWNPANMVFLNSPTATIATTKPIPDMDIRYTTLSVASGILDTRFSPDSTRELKLVAVGLGITDMGLTLAGGSRWHENTFGVSFAISPNHYNAIGVSLRILHSSTDLTDANSSGIAIDAGWTAVLTNRLYLALSGRNIVNRVKYPSSTQKIEPTWNVALAYMDIYKIATIEGDLVVKGSSIYRFMTAFEATLFENLLIIRGGVDRRIRDGARTIFTFGMGTVYSFSEISLGFRFDPEDAFGRQTFVSVNFIL